MRLAFFHIRFAVLAVLTCGAHSVHAQYKVKGTVYDSSRIYPIEAVSVLSTSGRITVTDSLGRYSIDVAEKDSIWFSFLGKPTPKYPVLKIADVHNFDIALRLKMNVMQEVRIRTRYYKEDSIQNRRDYAKAFDYQKPGLGTMTSVGPMGAGIDVAELIRLFQFRKNKAAFKFQQRLQQEERDKFIDRRFSKGLVRSITGLDGTELIEFMQKYRPTFEFTAGTSDYDFRFYIKMASEEFKRSKSI